MQLDDTKRAVPPGPPPRRAGVVSALRYAASFYFDPFAFVGSRFDRYGDIYYAPSGGVGLYVLRHPDHIREVSRRAAATSARRSTRRPSSREPRAT